VAFVLLAARHQALYVRVLHADHGSRRTASGGDRGAARHACTSARAHPGGSGAGFAGRGDVAAEADDVVEILEFLVAETAIRNYAQLDVRRQQSGQPYRHAMLVEAAVVSAAVSTVSHTRGVAWP
jgi:hypothetical protein